VYKKKGSKNKIFVCLFSGVLLSIGLIWYSLTPSLPVSGAPPTLYSNQCQQDLTLLFLEAIRKTKKSIYLVMFGLSDPSILKALQKKTNDLVDISIYYDLRGSSNLYPFLHACTLHAIRKPGLMHHKALLIDEKLVFLGSTNMTTHSLRMHDNLVIGLVNKQIATFLKEKLPYSSGHLQTFVGGQKIDLWILPDPKGHALYELKKKIRQSRQSIKIALFTFTHPHLVDELIAAHERGVTITIVLDMHSGLGASAKATDILKQRGIPVRFSQGVQLLHHKFMLIDDETLIAGSANWTKAAFTKNNDCLIMLHGLIPKQRSFMGRLWRRIIATSQPA